MNRYHGTPSSLVGQGIVIGSSFSLLVFHSYTTNCVAGMTDDLPTPCRSVHHLGRPFLPFLWTSVLNTFLSMCYSSLLITFPFKFGILSVIVLEACATLVVRRKCSFLILYLRVTPYIHLRIFIFSLNPILLSLSCSQRFWPI